MGAWLLTNPKSTIGWYDNLGKIAASGDNLQNLDTVQNELDTGKCLSMNQIPNKPHKFKLNAASCTERRRAICRIDAPTVASPRKPPQFPCIKQDKESRRKRDLQQLSEENRKYLFYSFLWMNFFNSNSYL